MTWEIIAHRGLSEIAPENTLIAFEKAIKNKADGLEFDLQLSADHQFVIIHDLTLDRTSNSQGKVKDLTLEELKQLDLGSWFDPQFKEEKIPTLREVFKLCQPHILKLYLEVKDAKKWQEQDIIKLINLINQEQSHNEIYLISFEHEFLKRIRQFDLKIKLGYNVKTRASFLDALNLAKKDQGHCISSEYHLLLNNHDLINKAHENQLKVIAWTVDHLEEMAQLQQLKIQGIMTNRLLLS